MIENLKRVSRVSVSDEIVDQLIDLISRGVLKPGQRMPSEKQLSQQFGVGRTSVREALRSLSATGIVESRPGEGNFVSEDNSKYLEKTLQWGLLLDRKVLEDLIETRLMLESHTSFLAAQKASRKDLNEISSTIERMEELTADPDEYLEFDLRFHLAIAQATQNSILRQLLSMTRGYLQVWIKETLSETPASESGSRAKLSIAEHRKIFLALEQRKADQAREAMTEHILSSSADLRTQVAARGHAPSAAPAS